MPSLLNHRQRISPFVLSLSKYERALCFSSLTLQIVFQSLLFDRLPSTGSGRSRANGLKNGLLTHFLRQAQDRQGERTGKALFDRLSTNGDRYCR
ncbi:MAG: hypothetical protein LBD67_03825 [Candidatus Accumulibacter sp.]|nr:hypothetical protein [Accumulibacter sp.]